MTTVLITGATSFIGRHLAAELQRAGMRVIGTSRAGRPVAGCDAVYRASLGDSLQAALESERPGAVVHCALDSGPDAYRINVDGTAGWLHEARAAGATVQILLSTLSAVPDAPSDYGRAKYALERRFSAANEVAFRLGVVVGDGGMYARLRESARRFPIVPMLDNGSQLLYVLGIDNLCWIVRDCIASDGAGLRGRGWNLHLPRAYTLREVIGAICRHDGRRRLLLSIPARPVLALLLLAEKLPLPKLPITSSNVKGLIRQGHQQIPTDFARFGYPERTLDELIDAVAGS